MVAASDLIVAGRTAMADNDRATAYPRFREACAEGPLDADGYADLATSAWWLGKPDECIDARERAFAGCLTSRETSKAALIALELPESGLLKPRTSPCLCML